MTFKTAEFQQIKQMDDFADCIINNRKSAALGEECLVDMKIIEAIKRSADTGTKIKMTW